MDTAATDDIPDYVMNAARVMWSHPEWLGFANDRFGAVETIARAFMVQREQERERIAARVDMALLDFAEDDSEGFARGHAHAKAATMRAIRNA